MSLVVGVAFLAGSGEGAESQEILVVQGRGDRGPYAAAVRRALLTVGVECQIVRIADVPNRTVNENDLVVLPYSLQLGPNDTNDQDVLLNSAQWSGPELEWLLDFVRRGGKTIAFYVQPQALMTELGFGDGECVDGRADESFGWVRTRCWHGLPFPNAFINVVPRAYVPAPSKAPNAVVGQWRSVVGPGRALPAIVINDRAALIGAPPSQDDLRNKGLALLAIMSRLQPEHLRRAAERKLREVTALPNFRPRHRTCSQMVADLASRAAELQGVEAIPADQRTQARRLLREAVLLRPEARRAIVADDAATGLQIALQANRGFEQAYLCMFGRGPADEIRGVWSTVPRPVFGWRRAARQLARGGINAIFPYMSSAGAAFYPSSISPVADGVRAGNDYLAECVEAAHQHGLAVHVWRTAWNMTDGPAELVRELEQAGRLVVSQNGKTRHWLCPSVEANRDSELQAFLEIPQLYDVDGIHLDYMRYPYYPPENYCFCASCRTAFESDLGRPVAQWPKEVTEGALKEQYGQWRKDVLTTFVAELRRELRTRYPDVQLSAALFGWPGARNTVGQDAAKWIDKGYLDLAVFMNYSADNAFYDKLVRLEQELVEGRTPVATGIGAFSHAACFGSPTELAEQISIGRRRQTDGFVVFKLTHTLTDEFLPMLSGCVLPG